MRSFIGDLPQAHDLAFRTGEHEGASQAVHPFSRLDLAHRGLTCRKDHEPGAPEVEIRDLERGAHPVFPPFLGRAGGPGKRKARAEERIVDRGRHGSR